ncbi:hypothetical protein [Allofustis seminis]|uniref:hypothetical protein n=1 Tax=Allofustis seminis TaxID=166939 RepID=UPI00036E1F2A|nr:hypothetical protein [Allofustis seminis]
MKIRRQMNYIPCWTQWADIHNLKISNLNWTSPNLHYSIPENIAQSSFLMGIFELLVEDNLLSVVYFIAHPDLFPEPCATQPLNLRTLRKLYGTLHKKKDEISGIHHLFMSFSNEEESQKFKQKIGDPLLVIQKEVKNGAQLLYYEEELAAIEAYQFVEMSE